MSLIQGCLALQVRNMPPHGTIYRSAIARMFRQCGKGKALFFEESRFDSFVEFVIRLLVNDFLQREPYIEHLRTHLVEDVVQTKRPYA